MPDNDKLLDEQIDGLPAPDRFAVSVLMSLKDLSDGINAVTQKQEEMATEVGNIRVEVARIKSVIDTLRSRQVNWKGLAKVILAVGSAVGAVFAAVKGVR